MQLQQMYQFLSSLRLIEFNTLPPIPVRAFYSLGLLQFEAKVFGIPLPAGIASKWQYLPILFEV
jgi:hypothetical protein